MLKKRFCLFEDGLIVYSIFALGKEALILYFISYLFVSSLLT